MYRKDTEPFISCFRVLTYNTSFQYLSIHAMSVIACYNYMLLRYLICTIYQGVHITYFKCFGSNAICWIKTPLHIVKLKILFTPDIKN